MQGIHIPTEKLQKGRVCFQVMMDILRDFFSIGSQEPSEVRSSWKVDSLISGKVGWWIFIHKSRGLPKLSTSYVELLEKSRVSNPERGPLGNSLMKWLWVMKWGHLQQLNFWNIPTSLQLPAFWNTSQLRQLNGWSCVSLDQGYSHCKHRSLGLLEVRYCYKLQSWHVCLEHEWKGEHEGWAHMQDVRDRYGFCL